MELINAITGLVQNLNSDIMFGTTLLSVSYYYRVKANIIIKTVLINYDSFIVNHVEAKSIPSNARMMIL